MEKGKKNIMIVNYLILAHKNPEQFHRLVRKLDSKNVNFFVHIDKLVDITAFKEPLGHYKNLYFLENKERLVTPWSDFNGCKVLITLLKKSKDKVNSDAYCIFLSGQDYPIVTNDNIYEYLKINYGKNFISIHKVADIWTKWRTRLERYSFHFSNNNRISKGIYPLTDKRCFSSKNFKDGLYIAWNLGIGKALHTFFKPKRLHPSNIEPVGGSAFWALPIETVIEMLVYIDEHPDFLDYHKYTHVPDEILFHSIINQLKSQDEIEKSITYTNWISERENKSSPVTFHTLDDLKELLSLGGHFLFARKFDINSGSFILDKLDNKICQVPIADVDGINDSI